MCCELGWLVQPEGSAPAQVRRSRSLLQVGAVQPRSLEARILLFSGAEDTHGDAFAQLRNGGHALGRDHAATFQLPVLLLLKQHRSHQTGDRCIVGQDTDYTGAALDFSIKPLEQVVLQTILQCCSGKWRKASTSSLASIMSSAALGRRSASAWLPDTSQA